MPSLLDELSLPPPNEAVAGRFYVHYKGGLYYVDRLRNNVNDGEDMVCYSHVSGGGHVRTRKDFESYVYKYDKDGVLNPEWGDRPGSVCVRFYRLPGNFKIKYDDLENLLEKSKANGYPIKI